MKRSLMETAADLDDPNFKIPKKVKITGESSSSLLTQQDVLAETRKIMTIIRKDSTTPGTLLPNNESAGIHATRLVLKLHQVRSQKPVLTGQFRAISQ